MFFVSLVQCPFSEHISPARVRRACFRLALFCSLLKMYQFWTYRMYILHQHTTLHSLGPAATHPPRVKSIGWMVLGIIKMQTDTQRFLPLSERRICSAPPSEASNIQCWLLPKLPSSKNGIRTSPRCRCRANSRKNMLVLREPNFVYSNRHLDLDYRNPMSFSFTNTINWLWFLTF